jgi:hypothetical protein
LTETGESRQLTVSIELFAQWLQEYALKEIIDYTTSLIFELF